jgi:hypothetical protein
MQDEKPDNPAYDDRVFDALAKAGKQYRDYVRLAQLGEFASQRALETLSYQRDWKHPLGLVITK